MSPNVSLSETLVPDQIFATHVAAEVFHCNKDMGVLAQQHDDCAKPSGFQLCFVWKSLYRFSSWGRASSSGLVRTLSGCMPTLLNHVVTTCKHLALPLFGCLLLALTSLNMLFSWGLRSDGRHKHSGKRFLSFLTKPFSLCFYLLTSITGFTLLYLTVLLDIA